MAKQNKKQNEMKHVSQYSLAMGQTRGRFFEGTVTKKFPTRVVIEFDRTVKIHKYERFYTVTTRIHARLPKGMEVQVGDYIQVQECRPLSKIIHHIVTKVIRSAESMENKK
ncbi:MAG: 30S ribosomal protein S17 [Nanoarchaeota archaeon]